MNTARSPEGSGARAAVGQRPVAGQVPHGEWGALGSGLPCQRALRAMKVGALPPSSDSGHHVGGRGLPVCLPNSIRPTRAGQPGLRFPGRGCPGASAQGSMFGTLGAVLLSLSPPAGKHSYCGGSRFIPGMMVVWHQGREEVVRQQEAASGLGEGKGTG